MPASTHPAMAKPKKRPWVAVEANGAAITAIKEKIAATPAAMSKGHGPLVGAAGVAGRELRGALGCPPGAPKPWPPPCAGPAAPNDGALPPG